MDVRRRRDPGQELVRDLEGGQEAAAARLGRVSTSTLREVFEREERRAFALALRVVGDTGVAEDAVQEAFAQLWERADRISLDGGRIESLLMTVVHRRAVDLARRRKRGETHLPDPELLQKIDERASAMLERVEENLTSDGLRKALQAALEALPEDQRVIVKQAYFGERTLRQIAEREGLPLGTVKSRLRLAMSKLTQAMQRRAP